MILHLLLAASAYLLGAAAVHAARRITQGSRMSASGIHLVLHTHNDSHHLEWALRSLALYSWLRGQPLALTICDADSTDDTRQMLQLFARRFHRLRIQTTTHPPTFQNTTPEHAPAILTQTSQTDTMPIVSIPYVDPEADSSPPMIHIRLGSPEDWGKLPYLI